MSDTSAPSEQTVSLVTKIVAEPLNLTYRGPSTKRGGGIFGGLIHRAGQSEITENGPKTVSTEVSTIDIIPDGTQAKADAVKSVTLSDSLLEDWKKLATDPVLEDQVKNFHEQLDKLLTGMQKKGSLGIADVQTVVKAMEPHNVGLIYKVHLVVSRVQATEFPKSGLASDGKYHRTVKSKVAYRRLDETDVEKLAAILNDFYVQLRSTVATVQRGDAWYRHFQVVDVTDHRGRTHKAIRTITQDGTYSDAILDSEDPD